MTIHAFLSHSLFFFFDFQKPTKTAVTSTRFKHKKFLVWKTLLVWTPAWSHMSTVSLSLRLCLCGLWVYLHAVKIVCMCCTRILVFMLHLCKKKKKKRLTGACGCCGWAGWGKGPWCGCLCVTSTHGDGGMRLHASPRMSGNVLCVCLWDECACACACVWFLMGQCGHTDHYVFVYHDEGLGIFAPETRSSCLVSLSFTMGFFLYVFLRCFFYDKNFTFTLLYCWSTDNRQGLGMFLLILPLFLSYRHTEAYGFILVGNIFNPSHCFSFCFVVLCYPV